MSSQQAAHNDLNSPNCLTMRYRSSKYYVKEDLRCGILKILLYHEYVHVNSLSYVCQFGIHFSSSRVKVTCIWLLFSASIPYLLEYIYILYIYLYLNIYIFIYINSISGTQSKRNGENLQNSGETPFVDPQPVWAIFKIYATKSYTSAYDTVK